MRAASKNQGPESSPKRLLKAKLAGTPLLRDRRSQSRYLARCKQLPSLFLLTLIKGLPSAFSRPAFHPLPLVSSAQCPSCHTILPPLPPSHRPGLDLALDYHFDRIQRPLDSPHLSWVLLFFLTAVDLCFTSPPGQGVEAGMVIHHLISGSCGGPGGGRRCLVLVLLSAGLSTWLALVSSFVPWGESRLPHRPGW